MATEIQFTKEMRKKLFLENEYMKGNPNYFKYSMECCFKPNGKKNFKFICWSIPDFIGVIKEYKGVQYIYNEDPDGVLRYTVSDEVKELLGI